MQFELPRKLKPMPQEKLQNLNDLLSKLEHEKDKAEVEKEKVIFLELLTDLQSHGYSIKYYWNQYKRCLDELRYKKN